MPLIASPEREKVSQEEKRDGLFLNLVCANCGCKEVIFKDKNSDSGMGYFCAKCGEYRYSGCL